ncbi:hypothetical protein TWF696_009926 [Orbilia brochopaga]|uniref:Uncharacterized protein n=1 Tax=Orbilia brochopaga TaxID=3140254 RepID=A0AAV9V2P4_9PEZI
MDEKSKSLFLRTIAASTCVSMGGIRRYREDWRGRGRRESENTGEILRFEAGGNDRSHTEELRGQRLGSQESAWKNKSSSSSSSTQERKERKRKTIMEKGMEREMKK